MEPWRLAVTAVGSVLIMVVWLIVSTVVVSAAATVAGAIGSGLFSAGSMAASRSEDRTTTRTYLDEVKRAAGLLGADQNHLWTAFAPTNVAIHRVNTAMELGDVQIALVLGPDLDTATLPTERQVRHRLEVSRAYNLAGRRDDAIGQALDAERLAPEQVRHHYMSRNLVLTWVRNTAGSPPVELDRLARRMHLVG